MNVPALDSASPALSAGSPPAHLAIIYEDFPSGLRAKRFCDQLSDALGGEVGPPTLWRMEMFEVPALAADFLQWPRPASSSSSRCGATGRSRSS